VVKKTLFAYRNFSGVGDWIMAMTVLKMVNQQYPDIVIDVNWIARNRFTEGNELELLPYLVQEIIKDFDVKIRKGQMFFDLQGAGRCYDYCTGHMVYKKDGTNFIEGMVKQFNLNTGLDLKYDDEVFAQYQPGGCGYDNTLSDLQPYILIQSCSKERSVERQGKDYGFLNMVRISEKLSKHISVIQIGQKTDLLIPNVNRFLSVELDLLHRLMINSVGFIGMDGGLGVYACHHSVWQYIIYEERERFSWTNFPYRMQLDGSRMDAEDVSDFIINNLEVNSETTIWKNTCAVS
jgi:hypothetical protein